MSNATVVRAGATVMMRNAVRPISADSHLAVQVVVRVIGNVHHAAIDRAIVSSVMKGEGARCGQTNGER